MIKKIHDLGKKGWGEVSPMSNDEKHYPNICVDTKLCPFLEDVEVGEKLSLLAICEVKSIRKDGENKPMEITLDVKKLGEEGEMKMTKAVEKAIGKHKELGEEGTAEHEKTESKAEREAEGED